MAMFECIVVPLDGSKHAEVALDYARDLAQKYSARLHLVRVLWPSLQALTGGEVVAVTQAQMAQEQQLARNYLEPLVQSLSGGDLKVSSQVALGDPAETVLDLAEDAEASLIVLTSHGRSGLRRWLMGSVAERIARHAHCPVMIVGRESVEEKLDK